MCLDAASTIKAGRPAKVTPPIHLKGTPGSVGHVQHPGRPRSLPPGFDEDVYRKVEALLADSADHKRPTTIKAAIESILHDLAEANGHGLWRLDESAYGRYRAAYGRGRKLARKT